MEGLRTMPLNKVKPGNMYQGWVDFTHNPLAGECPHQCVYCSTKALARRWPAIAEKYSGPPRLIEEELSINYGSGKTIFIENTGDLFAEGIQSHWIDRILTHCRDYPENTYVFQTKNPGRVANWIPSFPPRFLIGTTAETNWIDDSVFTLAPCPSRRLEAMYLMDCPPERRFITIEPIMTFDLDSFINLLLGTHVPTIYIGADSKGHHLPEPTGPEIKTLVEGLRDSGKTVVLKSNLNRLYKLK